ncbi:hypothetical protein, partial [Mycobacteroides abscessus]
LQSLGYDTPVPLIRSRLVHHSAGRNLVVTQADHQSVTEHDPLDWTALNPCFGHTFTLNPPVS